MKHLIYTVLIIIGTTNVFGQANFGTLKGKITDSESQEGIPGAIVSVKNGGNKYTSITNIDGKFTIKPLNPGTYNLQAVSGTDTLKMYGIEIIADKITFENDLEITAGLLDPLIITTSKRKLIDPEETKIITLPAKDIAKLPARYNINKIAQTMSSEIKVSDDGNEIYFRGSRNGDVIYYVDGVKVIGSRPLLPSSSIQAMRVYTGGIPAQYGDMMGGVIMVETKSYFEYYNIWKGKKEMEEYENNH